jgi:hypothetical protein
MGWKQPFPLAPIIIGTIQQTGRPYTSNMSQQAVNKLNQQYGVYLAQQKALMFQRELQMKRGGMVLPRGIEGEQPAEPAPGTSEEPSKKKSE